VNRATALVLLLGLSSPARGSLADWPHLRGPNYDAVSPEKGLVEAWPDDGPPMLWRKELRQGYSGFIGVGGRVLTQFQSSTGQYVLCLAAVSGSEVWRRRIDWPWQPAGAYPGPYATPTWHAGRIYWTSPAGQVGCLDAETGRPVWSLDVLKKIDGKGTGFGFAATPLVEDGKVILPLGGEGASVVALDAATGATVWKAGDDPASYCPVYPITFQGKRLAIALLQNSLVAHDLATGKVLWREGLSAGYDEHSAWPLYREPQLFTSSPFRLGGRLLRLEASGSPRAEWASRELSNDVCSSVLTGGHIYGFDLQQLQASAHRPSRGRFKCLDFRTGKLRWQTDRVGQATVVIADGKLVLLADTGTLILARAAPESYDELARAKVLEGGLCWTPPLLYHGRVYVRNPARAVCLHLGSPETIDPAQIQGTAASSGWHFDWPALLSREPEYPHDAPTWREVARWYGWCLVGVFGVAGVIAAVVGWVAPRAGMPVFAALAFVLGLAGTTVYSSGADVCILTWPASLYVAFRLTLAVVVWAESQPAKNRPRLVSRGVMLLFLALCYGYYRLCLAVGYVMAWGFLGGFLPAAPFAIVATKARRRAVALLADAVAFTVYFWASGMLPGLKGG
jgi:outer membrane protein assembly factor BamB